MRGPLRPFAVCAVLFLLAAASLVGGQGAKAAPYNVRIEFDQRVVMRDGVDLSTDVYRPDTAGRFPVILVRTPYDNGVASNIEEGRYWASHGYVYVVQDVRGRGDSSGEFYPIVHEAEDGYDTQAWAASQPWSTGKVGTTGGSYLGWTQVFPAGLRHPALAAMVPIVTPPDPVRNWPYRFGTISLLNVSWLVLVSGQTLQDLSQFDLEASLRVRPLRDVDLFFGRRIRAWRDWLDHPTLDSYWQPQLYQEKLLQMNVPALHISGWYDDVLVGTLENYVNLATRATDPQVRRHQRLLIGPWGHAVNTQRQWGRLDFGSDALIDLRAVQLQWFDHWLKGVANGVEAAPPVRIFVMGENRWRDEHEWPLARTSYTSYYLHSGGRANSAMGDGTLSTELPGNEPPDRYRYDPADPAPLITAPDFRQVGGPDDYRPVERRDDVLVYSTKPFTEAVEICGPLRFELFASSSARDTDWVGRVLDVHPDGFAQRLNEGVVRARFRNSLEREEPLTAGKVERYDLDAWATCIVFGAGHRLRVEITSSAFPLVDPNLNTGGRIADEVKGVPADQTIYHDRTRPSRLLVPIVPRAP